MLKKSSTLFIVLFLIIAVGLGVRNFILGNSTQEGGQSAQALFSTSYPNENNENKSLSAYKGKIVVLNFWATWCEPCREEMPELSALHTEYQDKNVVVLGLAIDDVAAIKAFSEETKVSYPLFAADGIGMELATSLGNNKGVLPYTVIINADGRVAKTYFGRVTKPLLLETLDALIQ